jgi:anti-sigma B factor antagonist
MKLQIKTLKDALHFAGDLDLYHVEAARDALRDCLATQAQVPLDLEGVTSCDASGLQLLLAARHSAATTGKHLQVAGPAVAVRNCCRQLGIPPETIFAPVQ